MDPALGASIQQWNGGAQNPLHARIDEVLESGSWLDGIRALSLAPSRPSYSRWLELAGASVERADCCAAALEAVETSCLDILLVDMLVQGQCGLSIAERLIAKRPWCRVVVVSAWLTAPLLRRSRLLPNACVVTQNLSQVDFVLATVSSSRDATSYLHAVAARIARRMRLSPQQERLFWLNLWGYSDQEIGPALGIQLHTVQDYQLALRRKTGVKSKAGYLRLLLEYLGCPAPLDDSERAVDSGTYVTIPRRESG